MGNARLLVEHALREVQTLLARARVSESTQREVRNRFLKLLGELRTHAEVAESASAVPAQFVCADIVADIVTDAVDRVVPKRAATRWEIAALKGEEERAALRQHVAELEAEVATLEATVNRRDTAHHYVMQSYFREVYTLRKDRAHVAHERDMSLHQQAVLSSALHTAGPSPQTVSGWPEAAASPATHGLGGGRPQSGAPGLGRLPLLRSGSVGSRMHEAASRPESAGGGHLERAGSQSAMSVSSAAVPRPQTAGAHTGGGLSTLASPTNPNVGIGSPAPPPPPLNTDAIFDYEKYLQLFSNASEDVTQRYMKLLADFEEFQKRAHAEREATLAHMQAEMDRRDRKIELLTRAQERSGDLVRGVHAQLQAERDRLATDREAIAAQLADAFLFVRTQSIAVYDTLEEVRAQNALIGEYVRTAAEMVAAIVSPHATLQEETKARDVFQAVLAPHDDDTEFVKRAKLYWRRHDASNATLAAVVAVRKALSQSKVLQGRMATLSDYALKESAEALRKAKALNDLRFEKQRDDMTLAALAESTRFSADSAFMKRLFAAGEDADFEMNDDDRKAIIAGALRRRELAGRRIAAACRRVRHRSIITNVRYTFELQAGAAEREHPGLDGRLAVQSHLQTLIDLRKGKIDGLLEETAIVAGEMLSDATELVAALPAELLYRVRNGIRRRADALLDEDGDEVSSVSSAAVAPRPPARRESEHTKSLSKSQRQDSRRPTRMSSRLESAARLRSTSSKISRNDAASDAEINALRDQVSALSDALAALQAELARMRRLRSEEDEETVGLRITAIEPPVPTGRFLPTMGGIGTPAVQDRSLEVLASAPDIGSTHRSPTRKRPTQPTPLASRAPSAPSARRTATASAKPSPRSVRIVNQ